MDKYCEAKSKKGLPISKSKYLLIGITSVFIACKFEELEFLSIVDVEEKLGHGKYSIKDIKMMEEDIL